MAMKRQDYSYREAPSVPDWDDSHGLIVFDGVCVLCSSFVQFVLRNDKAGYFHFTTGQSALGQALYRHYGLDTTDFETNLVITDGRLYSHAATVAEVGRRLGWPWKVFMLLRAIPAPIANWCYNRIARNRFTLFGRRDTCLMPSALQGRYVE
jgi:predicted DCC family thiol-disulfide oxidoreductase YuxK